MTMRIQPKTRAVLASLFVLPIAAAYLQWGLFGLPPLPESPPLRFTAHDAFPTWMRVTHYVNFFFMILLVRSGLQILMSHPRLYWNVHCTPGTEWLRLTPVEVPRDRLYTARDDSGYLSPWVGLPGYQHTMGMARHWHFLSAVFWIGNGLIFVVLLLGTEQWRRLVPTSWRIIPDAWSVFVHYTTFHLPQGEETFYRYNALQQLAISLAMAGSPHGVAGSPALTLRPLVGARDSLTAGNQAMRGQDGEQPVVPVVPGRHVRQRKAADAAEEDAVVGEAAHRHVGEREAGERRPVLPLHGDAVAPAARALDDHVGAGGGGEGKAGRAHRDRLGVGAAEDFDGVPGLGGVDGRLDGLVLRVRVALADPQELRRGRGQAAEQVTRLQEFHRRTEGGTGGGRAAGAACRAVEPRAKGQHTDLR
jgi:hypothetical protein